MKHGRKEKEMGVEDEFGDDLELLIVRKKMKMKESKMTWLWLEKERVMMMRALNLKMMA